jgi:hypothetical protein
MKNRRLLGLTALLGACLAISQPILRAQGSFQAPAPDLKVLSVSESGSTAYVVIRNTGAANATGTFMVRAFEWKNGAWYGAGYKWVNGLAVGTNLTVAITAPGIGNSTNKYVVDSNDNINESNENNNVYYVLSP